MPTPVDIWNQALGRIGGLAYLEDEADPSNEARWCRTYYAGLRDALLRRHDWPFARRVFWPGTLTFDAPSPWLYCLEYPPQCAAIRGYHLGSVSTGSVDPRALPAFVVSSAASVSTAVAGSLDPPSEPFRVAGETDGQGRDTRYVLTQSEGGFIRYTAAVEDLNLWSPDVLQVLVWRLARDVANAMARRDDILKTCEQMAERELQVALVAATREATVTVPTMAGAGLDAVRA